MFSEIIAPESLFIAWREFRKEKTNRHDVLAFEWNLERDVFALHRDLRSGKYRHAGYTRFHVFDPKHRIIHKATVRDRLVHHAVYRVLLPIFERSFIFDSYSCRVGKGTHAAVRRLEVFARRIGNNYTGPCWALKFDIRRFFDSVDQEILLNILAKKIDDERVMALLREIVTSFPAPNVTGGGVAIRAKENRIANRQLDVAIVCQRVPGCI